MRTVVYCAHILLYRNRCTIQKLNYNVIRRAVIRLPRRKDYPVGKHRPATDFTSSGVA